jgi:8-oxo-dGTP pyrophosphatase MutT (NUDIX family)
MGAGVLPFVYRDGDVWFLMQTVFSGRKAGFLNDFGGGVADGESACRAAAREFIEETETLFLSASPAEARRTTALVDAQMPIVESLFDETLSRHPDWWCERLTTNPAKPKCWKTFFIEFPFRDVEPLNRLWADDADGRYRKRRELHWISAATLIGFYRYQPQRLWKRVRQLGGAEDLIRVIQQGACPAK